MKNLLSHAALAIILQGFSGAANAQTALEGQVASVAEGPMEGVLVSAKKDGSTITTSVVTDASGHYAFPAGRLAPGQYAISIRAAGYDLSGATSAQIAAGKPAHRDLTLKAASDPISQLSNAEWLESVPGAEKQHDYLIDCVDCHSVERIFKSSHTSAEFIDVFKKMATMAPGAVPEHIQTMPPGAVFRSPGSAPDMRAEADFLSSVNLNGREGFNYPLKRLPRPKGRATHVIFTEYDLPRGANAHPHDVVVDADGIAWYADFSSQFIGSLDPKTGKVKDYALPEPKPDSPKGTLDIELDKQGNLWISMQHQSGVVKFDRKTKKIMHYPIPAEWQSGKTQQSFVTPSHSDVDGLVWTNNQDMRAIYRLDPKTGKYEDFGPQKNGKGLIIGTYGIPSDLNNNVYLLEFRMYGGGDALVPGSNIGVIDAKTKQLTVYPTPTPGARPRRGRIDDQNRLWFAEYRGNAIAMFDPATKQIQEWRMPTKWDNPYDVVADRNGEVWAASMLTDQVQRLDPKTGATVEYLLPRKTNMRRVFVDNTQAHPALWVGSVHGGSIVRVEPLD